MAPLRDRWACAGLLLLTIAVFWPWLFVHRALYWGDFGLYFQPLLHFHRAQLLRGTTPLWNPALFCGTPFAGNPQAWPLYPASLMLPLLPASQFLTVSCAAHAAVAGLGFFLFLRRTALALGTWPALIGAAAFCFGGCFVTKAQYPNMLQALAWTPWILWTTEHLARRPAARPALALAAALGLQLLASHAQVTLYTLYFALVLAVFTLLTRPRQHWARAAGWGALALMLALGLSCGEWLPALEAHRLAARQTLTLAHVNRLHLPWDELTNFALPWRFGNPLSGNWRGAGPLWETACYAGTLPLALALLACLRPKSRPREIRFWLAVFIVSAWLALGTKGGLFPLAYALLPGMKLFHDPARLLLGAAVALPVLAALGLQNVLPHVPPRLTRVAGLACLLITTLDLGFYDRQLYPLKPIAQLETVASPVARALQSDPVLASGQGRIFTVDDITADTQFLSWTDYEQNVPRYLPRLLDTLLPNQPALLGLANSGGYEPLALAAPARLYARAAQNLRSGLPALPGLSALAVRAVIFYRPSPPPPIPGLRPLLTWDDADGVNHGFILRPENFAPRARLTTSAPVRFVRDDPDHIILALPPLAAPAALTLTDTNFPGWTAAVDGHAVPISPAPGVGRTVTVLPGARRVTFTYHPASYQIGLYVTLLSLCGLVASGVFCLRRTLP